MSLSRIKTWNRNEILLSTDLNAEFNNILQNGSSLVFPLSNDLDVGSKLLINTGLQAPSQLHDSILTMDKFSNSLPVAIASIGSSKITLLVGSAITVGADATIPDNIILWFVGPGKLFVNSGKVLTINSPSQVLAHTQQQVFDGTGTVTFTNGGIVSPGWWGFSSGGTAATNADAYNACTASLSATGGAIIIPPTGTAHQVDDTLTHPAKPMSVIGAHPELSIIESTATASLKHGLTFTRSHHVRNLTIKTSASLASNYYMYAVRMNLDGVTVSGGNQSVKWESVKVRGFNNSFYVDGGDAYNIDRLYFSDLDCQCSGPASTYIGSCLYANRVNQVYGTHSQFDQNSTGEHAIYCFGVKNLVFDGFKIRNADKGLAQAIKVVGNGIPPDDDQAYATWSIRNMDIADCLNGILCGTYGTETLEALTVENCKFVDVDTTSAILACVFLSAAGSSSIRTLRVSGISTRNCQYQGVHVSTGATATMGPVSIHDCKAYNWSTASAGTYTWFGSSGTGTFGPITITDIEADGNSNGRTILSDAGQASTISRIRYAGLKEVNTTNTGRPISLATADATPSMAIGNWFIQPNGSAQNVTAYDGLEANQTYYVRFSTANTTLLDGANLQLAGSIDYTPPANTFMTFYCSDGTTLYEVSRSAN